MSNLILRPTADGNYTTWDGFSLGVPHTPLYDLIDEADYVVGTGDDDYISTSTAGAFTVLLSDAVAGSWPRATRICSVRVVAVVRQIGASCDFKFRLRSLDQDLDSPVQTLTATSYTEVGHTFTLGLNAYAWDVSTINRMEAGLVFDSGDEMRCTKLEVYVHYELFPHYTLEPEGAGAAQQWSPVPATSPAYMTVSGVYDGDLSYLANSTVNDQSVFVTGDLPATLTPPNIDRVAVKALVKNVGTVVEEADALLRSATIYYNGGTNTTSVPIQPDGEWVLLSEEYLNDPNVAWPSGHPSATAWTASEVNALQIGVENSGGGDFRCTSVALEVWLAPTAATSIDLFPTADGYHQDWGSIVGAATAWQATDEDPPDNATSYITLDANTLGISAYSSFDVGGAGSIPTGERIYNVELRYRVRLDNLPHSSALVAPVIRDTRAGETYVGRPQLLEGMASTWFDVKWDFHTSPHTGLPWVDLAEVTTDLEYGFVVLEGAMLLSRVRAQVHTVTDFRAATVDSTDAVITTAAETLIVRSQTDGTIYGVTEFSVGTGGYDTADPATITTVNPADTALANEVYRAGIDRIEYDHDGDQAVDYWCRVPKEVAQGGIGELALWAEIFWSPIPSEIGTSFMFALSHHPCQARHLDDVHFYRATVTYWDLGAELLADGDMEYKGTQLLADGDMEYKGTQLLADGDMEYKGTQLLADGDMEYKGTQLLADGDMEYKGTQLLADGDMEVVGPTLIVDGDMEAGPGSNAQVDGDMEAVGTAAWTAGGGAVLAKTAVSPHGGLQAMRVTGGVGGFCRSTAGSFTVGRTYATHGWARSDGTNVPTVIDAFSGVTVWTGTTSTSWQEFTAYSAVGSNVGFGYRWGSGAGTYVDFDDITTYATCPSWTSAPVGLLTKSTASPHGGSQALRVAYNGTANPAAVQLVLVASNWYRVRGWARGDGTVAPVVYITGSALWTGTSSTSWQAFDVTFAAVDTLMSFRMLASSGWVEFDDIVLTACATDTADWTLWRAAVLSKQAGAPGGSGDQVLRVAYGGTSQPAATQTVTTASKTYRVVGWARGDGTYAPQIQVSVLGTVWTGTTSASWQAFDFSFIASGTGVYLYSLATAAGWAEFDDVVITEDCPSWTPLNAAVLSKEAGSPGGSGSQVLRVTYNGTSIPQARQIATTIGKTYRVSGWGRGDGTYIFTVRDGGVNVFVGTSSTTWQWFDVAYVATSTSSGVTSGATAAGWCEFDDLVVTEDCPSWTAANAAVMSKQAGAPGGSGAQVLRIAYNGTSYPYAYQVAITTGKTYRFTGWARGDGASAFPRVYVGTGGYDWTGTTSTTWQWFDVSAVADSTWAAFMTVATAAGYCEFDDIVVTEDCPSWTALNAGILSKQAGSPGGSGSQVLRVAYGGTSYPQALQTVLTVGKTYRFTGYARGDGTAFPRIFGGTGSYTWQGTSSTTWQYFDFSSIAAYTFPLFQATTTAAGYCEFDDIVVTEDCPSWPAWNSGLASKETGAPGGTGTQVLHIAYNGTNNPGVQQAVLTAGNAYRTVGVARGDGTYAPRVYLGSSVWAWTGTTSTSWQEFEALFVAPATGYYLHSNATAAGWAEFDNCSVREIVSYDFLASGPELLIDGNQEAAGVAAWTAGNSAVLTKEIVSIYEGTQIQRITYNAVNDPYTAQTVLTPGLFYRVQGVMRSDGTGVPEVREGTALVWQGVSTTTYWQSFDRVFKATSADIRFQCTIAGAGYCDIDVVSIKEVTLP